MTEAPKELERRPRSALIELTITRYRLFMREPSAVFWTFGFPVVLAVALGIAFRNRPPEAAHVAVQAGPAAEATLMRLQRSDAIKATIEDPEQARMELRVGKISLLVIPGTPRTYRYDDMRPEARLARLLVDDCLQREEGRVDATPVAEQRITEPGARYIDFLMPGLLGFTLMSSSLWGIGYVIVELRTKKLVKRLVATPMKKRHFLASFVLMRALFVLFEMPLLVAFGWVAFGVRVNGSLLLVLGISTLGALSFAGLGVLVASRAQNMHAVGGLLNVVMMPMFVGSGVFFASTNFPDIMQPFLKALPLTALNDALRAVINEGAGPGAIAGQMGVLALWGLVSFAVSVKIFRWL